MEVSEKEQHQDPLQTNHVHRRLSSPNCKILSATCEVAIKLRNIALQQVRWKKKMAFAHACCEFDFFYRAK